MKSVYCIFLVGFFVTTKLNGQNAQTSDCGYRQETKQLYKVLDSLTNFVKNIKDVTSANDWNHFVAEVENEKGLDAFDMLGLQGSELKSKYEMICLEASTKLSNLIIAIDPRKEKSDEEIKRTIEQEIRCFISDTVENSLSSILNGYGRFASPIGGGPCEREVRTCLDNAANSYTTNMIACGFGGGAIAQWVGGWWGVASGGGCAILANIRHNNAKWTCVENYVDCIH